MNDGQNGTPRIDVAAKINAILEFGTKTTLHHGVLTYELISRSTSASEEARILRPTIHNLFLRHSDDIRVRGLRLLQNAAMNEARYALWLTRPIYTEQALLEYIQIAENESHTEEKEV